MKKSCAVVIVTYDRVENVANLALHLKLKADENDLGMFFHIGVSCKSSFQKLTGDKRLPDNCVLVSLNDDSYWAASFQNILKHIEGDNYQYFLHVNDDLEINNITSLDFDSIFKANQIAYGKIYGKNYELIFGKRLLVPFERILPWPKFDVINGNFFSCPFSEILDVLPKYRFSHSFLDYVITARLLKKGLTDKPIEMTSLGEGIVDRTKVMQNIKSIKNSRLNPFDAFMMYWYLGRPLVGAIVSLYCIGKIAYLKMNRGFRVE
jgi:hypothetical protein